MKLQRLKAIYDEAVSRMITESDYWKGFLEYASQMYRYEFSTLASLYAQNEKLTQFATFEDWNRLKLQVRQGERSIPALMSNRFGMVHMFDASQLYQAPKIKSWIVENKERADFEERFIQKNKAYAGFYTNSYSDIQSSMIVEQMNLMEKQNQKKENQELFMKMQDVIFQNVDYMIQYRCNNDTIDLEPSLLDLKLNSRQMAALGRYILNISRPILLNCKEVVMEMRKENVHERGKKDRSVSEWNGNGLRGEGWDLLRGREGGAGRTVHESVREIRKLGQEVLGGKQRVRVGGTGHRGNHDENNASDRGQSKPEDGGASDTNAEERSAQESKGHNGDISSQTEDTRPGRRDSAEGNSVQLELDLETLHLNSENGKGVVSAAPFFEPNIKLEKEEITASEKINYKYDVSHNLYEGGLKTKFQNNIAAIRLLKDMEKENRLATVMENQIMKMLRWSL